MVDFTPQFFSRPTGASSSSLASSATNSSSFASGSDDTSPISHKYSPNHGKTALENQRPAWRGGFANAQSQFRDNMPVAQNGVPGSALTVSDIDWSRHENIMSDSSRVKFGQKLSGQEVGGRTQSSSGRTGHSSPLSRL